MLKQIIEGLKDSNGNPIDQNIIQYVLDGFNVVTQTHVYHLLTKSHAEHIAIGEFYDSLQGCLDAIAEKGIGLGLQAQGASLTTVLMYSYNKNDLMNLVKGYRGKTTSMIEATNNNELMSINDKLIQVQSSIDTLLYKLQLK